MHGSKPELPPHVGLVEPKVLGARNGRLGRRRQVLARTPTSLDLRIDALQDLSSVCVCGGGGCRLAIEADVLGLEPAVRRRRRRVSEDKRQSAAAAAQAHPRPAACAALGNQRLVRAVQCHHLRVHGVVWGGGRGGLGGWGWGAAKRRVRGRAGQEGCGAAAPVSAAWRQRMERRGRPPRTRPHRRPPTL